MALRCRAFTVVAIAAAVAAAIAAWPGAAMAGAEQAPMFYGKFNPAVGSWASYRIRRGNDAPQTMRMSIVGAEKGGLWFETEIAGAKGEKVITKMLTPTDPRNKNGVTRFIVKSGNQPAMEMQIDGMKLPEADKSQVKAANNYLKYKKENVTVPAGTFNAYHVTPAGSDKDKADVWITPNVGPYGLIKVNSKGGVMELLQHGSGAKTAITEKPQKMPSMQEMMRGQGMDIMKNMGGMKKPK